MFGEAVGSMGTFIVIVFFAAQLLAFLKWSNLGIIAAVKGAKLLGTSKWDCTNFRNYYSKCISKFINW